jgi:glutamine synthetase
MIATTMPKPIALDKESGLHINISLWNDNTNLFFDQMMNMQKSLT